MARLYHFPVFIILRQVILTEYGQPTAFSSISLSEEIVPIFKKYQEQFIHENEVIRKNHFEKLPFIQFFFILKLLAFLFKHQNIQTTQFKIMSTVEQSSLRESLLTAHEELNHNSTEPNGLLIKTQAFHNSNFINGDSIFQTTFFTWIYSLLKYGSKQPIKVDSMPSLPNKLKTETQLNRLRSCFNQTTISKRPGLTLSKALFKTYIGQFSVVLIFLVIYVGLAMFSPFLTSIIMKYIGQDSQTKDISQGQILFFITLLSTFIMNLGETHVMYHFTQLGINMTNSLTMLIYQKSLKYASLSEKSFTESEIINYSQVDAERMTYMGYQLAAILVAPLQIIVGIVMMYQFIGVSFVSGLGVMILMIGCTYFVNKRSVKYNEEVLVVKDQRMKVTQQMLDIIRYIKINAIEKFFYKKVDEKRMNEISLYKKKGFMDVLNIFIYWLACPCILSGTFLTYIMIGNRMTSEVAFTTIMIFAILQYPIRLLPNCISQVIQIYTSIKRIQKYLVAQELKKDHVKQHYDEESQIAIKIQRGDFYWGLENKKKDDKAVSNKNGKKKKNEFESQSETSSVNGEQSENELKESKIYTSQEIDNQPISEQTNDEEKPKYTLALQNINTTIQKSKLTILLGDIGSGKTSLILAILNQMRCSKQTSIQINGSIAYTAQRPWIMSGTVRENIIFANPYDQLKFNRVIHFASLEHDIKILPKGIQTEIGEKGVNLSGGQKARISLARALYSEQDIYLFDDILSAVDVHVGEFLMKETLLGYLKGKTIIMPTHAVKFAEFVDEIIIMKKGRIVRKGHYHDISHTPQFKEISMKQKKKVQKQQSKKEENLEEQLAMMKNVLITKSDGKDEIKATEDIIVQELMLPEDHVRGKVDLKIFREYIELNGGLFRFAFLVCLAMFLWISSCTAASIIMEKWCESQNSQNGDQSYLYIYIALSILSNVFIFFRAYTLVLSGAKQGQAVHKSMMKSLLYASLGNFYNRVPVGRIINRLTKDLRELDESIGFAIGSFLVDIFTLFSTLAICIYASTPFIIIPIMLVAFITNKIRVFYLKTQRQVSRLEKSTNSPIVTGFISGISGLSTIRAYRKQQFFKEYQINFTDINKKVRLNKSALSSWFSLTLTYISFFINMVAIGYCILSTNNNASLAGLLMNYAIDLSGSINRTIMSIANFETKIVALERIYNFMKITPEPAYTEYCLNWTAEEEGYRKVVTQGRIQFKDTNVKYRKDLPYVLKGLNCVFNQGQKIGIVGRTGAGKTTIINTLLRITEIASGDVLIDGQSIQSLPIKDMRNDITMIDQEPTLIKSTFQENLDITARYTEQELEDILKECNLYQTIIQKGGLQGKVSNDSLSVGEKQLLCICRAFLKKSKIVLIDEATANIDLKNDQIIQRVIHDKFKDCTVLTIAHRLSTLKNADKILVMESGQIIEFGTPAELQEKPNGFYRQMLKKNAQQFLI